MIHHKIVTRLLTASLLIVLIKCGLMTLDGKLSHQDFFLICTTMATILTISIQARKWTLYGYQDGNKTEQTAGRHRTHLNRHTTHGESLINVVMWTYTTPALSEVIKQYTNRRDDWVGKLANNLLGLYAFVNKLAITTVLRIIATTPLSIILVSIDCALLAVIYCSAGHPTPLSKLVEHMIYVEGARPLYTTLGLIQITLVITRRFINTLIEKVCGVSIFASISYCLGGLFQYSSSDHNC